MSIPERFESVAAVCKANVYFEGKVISHTIFVGNDRKTLGVILPGEFQFDTSAPERVEIASGTCRVKLSGESEWTTYETGSVFHVSGNDSFDIAVDQGHVDYICSYLTT